MGGNPRHSKWSSTPENLRHQVKLNVRLEPALIALVDTLARERKKTKGEIVAMALVDLANKFKAQDAEAATQSSEREILAAARALPSSRPSRKPTR